MKKFHATRWLVVIMAMTGALNGCAASENDRTPEEWLSLSYAGLAAMDQYAFTGSMSMGIDQGVLFKPQLFDGKVVNHHQLTIQSEQQDSLYWNPVEVLKALNQSHEAVGIEANSDKELAGDRILILTVKEKSDASKERWGSALRQQLEMLQHQEEDLISNHQAHHAKKRKELLAQASLELDDMLDSLKVSTRYEIMIDRDELIPLKIEEKTLFDYMRKGHLVKESRHTKIRFEAFDRSMTAPDHVQ